MILRRQILPDSAITLLKVVAPNGQRQKVSVVAPSYNGIPNPQNGAHGIHESIRRAHFYDAPKPTSAPIATRSPFG